MPTHLTLLHEVYTQGLAHEAISEILALGSLKLTAGPIIACDPLVEPDAPPFTQMLPQGDFPAFAYLDEEGELAYLALQFSPNKALRWEMALCPDQDPSELEADEIFGFGVDTGYACLMSQTCQELLLEDHALRQEDGAVDLAEVIDQALDNQDPEHGRFAHYYPLEQKEHNVLIVKAGLGDGFYAAYFGYDAQGQIACMMIDFDVFEVEGEAVFDFNLN